MLQISTRKEALLHSHVLLYILDLAGGEGWVLY